MCPQTCQHIFKKIFSSIPTIYFHESQGGSWENEPTINHAQLFSALTIVNVLILLVLLPKKKKKLKTY